MLFTAWTTGNELLYRVCQVLPVTISVDCFKDENMNSSNKRKILRCLNNLQQTEGWEKRKVNQLTVARKNHQRTAHIPERMLKL